MKFYNVHNFAQLQVVGAGRVAKEIQENLCYFDSEKSDLKTIKILIDDSIKKHPISSSLGNERKLSFHKKNKNFYIKKNGDVLLVAGDKNINDINELIVSSNFDIGILMLLIELNLRQLFIKNDIVLFHGSAAETSSNGVVFFGWQGAGKTSAVISCILNGYNFLSEDKIWLSQSEIFAYPRYVRINSSNIHLFIKEIPKLQRFIYYLVKSLEKIKEAFFIPKILSTVLNKGLLIPSIKMNISDLVPGAEISTKANLSKLIYIERSKSNNIYDHSPKDWKKKNSNISFYEWNAEIIEILCAHDSLFQENSSWVEQFNIHLNSEMDVTLNIFRKNNVKIIKTSLKQSFFNMELID